MLEILTIEIHVENLCSLACLMRNRKAILQMRFMMMKSCLKQKLNVKFLQGAYRLNLAITFKKPHSKSVFLFACPFIRFCIDFSDETYNFTKNCCFKSRIYKTTRTTSNDSPRWTKNLSKHNAYAELRHNSCIFFNKSMTLH